MAEIQELKIDLTLLLCWRRRFTALAVISHGPEDKQENILLLVSERLVAGDVERVPPDSTFDSSAVRLLGIVALDGKILGLIAYSKTRWRRKYI